MMKRILLLPILALVSFTSFAQWIPVASGTTVQLYDVHFPGDSVGYIVGDNGTVLRSTDTGISWNSVHTDTISGFNSVFFTSVDIGYATGGRLYKTVDGGGTWTEIPFVDSLNQIREVYFVNDSVGFASGSRLFKTVDAGASWTAINLNSTFSSIYFPGDSVGYFVGGTSTADALYRTTDQGQTFTQIQNGFQSIKEATYFLNDTLGFLCGWYGGVVVKTTDGGMNWIQIDTSHGGQCWDVYFEDESTGYYIDNTGGTYDIRATTNGGGTWTTQLTGNGYYLNEFFFITPSIAVAVGDSGTIYRTDNGGSVGIPGPIPSQGIRVFPNPSSTRITVELKSTPITGIMVDVYSVFGQRIKTVPTDTRTTILDIGALSPGIYLIVIADEHGRRFTRKIIKK